MSVILKPNPSLGVPIYLQLMEQVKHAIETGALRAGDQLPGIRPLAEELVINANTVAKAYRELEHEGVLELRHGAGAFVSGSPGGVQKQADRFRDRLNEKHKWWKFNPNDLEERRRWDDYLAAFEDAVSHCSTPWAPWYVIPADQKWYRNLHIAQIVRKALEALDFQYPQPSPDLESKIDEFLAALEAD